MVLICVCFLLASFQVETFTSQVSHYSLWWHACCESFCIIPSPLESVTSCLLAVFPSLRGLLLGKRLCPLCSVSRPPTSHTTPIERLHAISDTLWADVPKSVDVSFKLPIGLYNSLTSIFICVFLGHCDVNISQSKFITFPLSKSPFLPTLSSSVNEMARPYRHSGH